MRGLNVRRQTMSLPGISDMASSSVWFRRARSYSENILEQLDSDAWDILIGKVLPYSCSKDKSRVWQNFWNHLDESRGYVLLKERGYSNVKFIPPPKNKKGKSEQFADLEGKTLASRAILEVKTINRSEDDLHKHDPIFWVGRKGENGKSRRAGDIKNPLAFANNLRNKSDPVSAFLWEKLDSSDQESLANCQPTPSEIEQMDSILCRFLNEIIKGDCIYEKEPVSWCYIAQSDVGVYER